MDACAQVEELKAAGAQRFHRLLNGPCTSPGGGPEPRLHRRDLRRTNKSNQGTKCDNAKTSSVPSTRQTSSVSTSENRSRAWIAMTDISHPYLGRRVPG